MADLLSVAVIMGGQSGEHDVSIKSGAGVLASLPAENYAGFPVIIGADGRWQIDDHPPCAMVDALKPFQLKTDVAFLALHGPNGEDGTMQALCHLLKIPYTGSDYYASSLAMNKPRAKDVFRSAGLKVARHVSLFTTPTQGAWMTAEGETVTTAAIATHCLDRLGTPVVPKTTKLGSSVGVGIAYNHRELGAMLDDFSRFGGEIMVEEYLTGTEVTASVIDNPDNRTAQALPLIEIRPRVAGWFDYRAKYEVGGAEEICPAPVADKLFRKCQEIGLKTHRLLGCRGMSRTDIIAVDDTDCYVIETNTIPGFTETSLLPQAASQAGISYSQLVDLLIRNALEAG